MLSEVLCKSKHHPLYETPFSISYHDAVFLTITVQHCIWRDDACEVKKKKKASIQLMFDSHRVGLPFMVLTLASLHKHIKMSLITRALVLLSVPQRCLGHRSTKHCGRLLPIKNPLKSTGKRAHTVHPLSPVSREGKERELPQVHRWLSQAVLSIKP